MTTLNSKISNSEEAKDKNRDQDVNILNPYIHYAKSPFPSGYRINYTDQYTKVVQIFDRYSDYYTDEDQRLPGAFGSPNESVGNRNNDGGTISEPVDDQGTTNE